MKIMQILMAVWVCGGWGAVPLLAAEGPQVGKILEAAARCGGASDARVRVTFDRDSPSDTVAHVDLFARGIDKIFWEHYGPQRVTFQDSLLVGQERDGGTHTRDLLVGTGFISVARMTLTLSTPYACSVDVIWSQASWESYRPDPNEALFVNGASSPFDGRCSMTYAKYGTSRDGEVSERTRYCSTQTLTSAADTSVGGHVTTTFGDGWDYGLHYNNADGVMLKGVLQHSSLPGGFLPFDVRADYAGCTGSHFCPDADYFFGPLDQDPATRSQITAPKPLYFGAFAKLVPRGERNAVEVSYRYLLEKNSTDEDGLRSRFRAPFYWTRTLMCSTLVASPRFILNH